MKKLAYIYQYNELINGHSIYDKRLCSALEIVYGRNFYPVQYNLQTNSLIGITKDVLDVDDTIVILSHFNTFKIAGWFKKCKVVFLNHDLPYYAYLLQQNYRGLIKAVFSWVYIHYYWRKASFIFFISKVELRKSGISPDRCAYIRVGTKPSGGITDFKELFPVALFTGNYKWSLKAKALENAFKDGYNGELELAAINVDDTFLRIVRQSETTINYQNDFSEKGGIMIGVITDDFLSGFKLKALELIFSGCCLVSFSDIIGEFDDVVNADLFIHKIEKLDELDLIYANLKQQPDIVDKYKLFYNDICRKFNWGATALEIKNELSKI